MKIAKHFIVVSIVVLSCLDAICDTKTETVDGITWTYTVSNGVVSVGGGTSSTPAIPKTTKGVLTIPSSLGGCSVASIGKCAFYGCDGLTSVTIPDSVASIGVLAFCGCSRLTSVVIPGSVTSIEGSTFSRCSSLKSVTIPDSVTSIGDNAFSDCSGLKSVTIPDSVTSIGSYAFRWCCVLKGVTIPYGVTNIGAYAFQNCSGLKSVTISDSVTIIGERPFEGCGGLTDVTVSQYVLERQIRNVFPSACSSITNILYSSVITNISYAAFRDCNGLANVMIPDSVTRIGGYAFYNCTNLTSITIPDSVTSIGGAAFYLCTRFASVTIPPSVKTIGDNAFAYCRSLSCVTIPHSVTSIVGSTFYGCSNLASVTIPPSVITISDYAFVYCSSLTSVYLPKEYSGSTRGIPSSAKIIRYTPYQNVTLDTTGGAVPNANIEVEYGSTYGDLPEPSRVGYTFDGWTLNGEAVSADTTVTTLDDHTLVAQWTPNKHTVTFDANGGEGGASSERCYGTVIVAPTVTRVGYSFKGWDKEVAETVPDEDVAYVAQWQINQYNVIFDANGGVGGMVDKLDYGTVITAPLVSRAGCTFEGWSPSPDQTVPAHDVEYTAQWKVWDITVNSADSSIRELYPDDYFRITNIVIGAEVDCVPTGFFDGCDAVECLTFRSGDTDLGDNNLRSVGNLFEKQPDGFWIVQGALVGYKGRCPEVIPQADTIKRVVSGALEGCVALEELSFTAESVLGFIGDGAFRGCTELKTMTLPPSLESIGDEAFMGCSYLGDVIVPGSVRRVGDRAFKNCTGFTAAQIEYGVESLGEEAFFGDWRISEVDIPSTVTNIGVNAFGGDSSIVRIGLRGDVRKASEIFSNYRSIREATVKEGVGEIVDGLFCGFESLRDVHFMGNCPALENEGRNLYDGTPANSAENLGLVTYVEENSTGWDGTPGSHSLPQAWPLAGNRRSVATWDVPTYLCQFDSNGGTLGVQDTYQRSENKFVFPPEPVQTGYSFAGWWTQPVGGLCVTKDTVFIEGVYTRLYAHWIKGRWVFLDPNGGTVINDFVTYVEQTTYGVLPVPVRSGYAFGGWLYNGNKIEPDTAINEKADHTLVAQWTANLYSVHYNANGGTGAMSGQGFIYGESQELRKNTLARDGYEFAGWATNAVEAIGVEDVSDVIVYSDGEAVSNLTAVASGWIELYAVWRESEISSEASNLDFHSCGDADWTMCNESVTVEKDGETCHYSTVWKSGVIANNQKSVLMANVYGAGTIGFWWKVSCESFRDWKLDNLEFAIDGVAQEPWINGEKDWAYIEFDVETTGAHTLTWTYSKDEEGSDGEDCGWITAAVWTPRLDALGDYVNSPALEFTSGGDAEWQGDEETSHDGIASLRSGPIGDGEVSTLETEVDGAGRIGFWWKVSSETFRNQKIDYVSFSIDDVEQAWLGGEIGWTNVLFDIVGNGLHTLRWEYRKDDWTDTKVGEDCAWLDEVVWTPKPTAADPIPAVATDAAPEVVVNAIESAGFADAEALKAAIGGNALEYGKFKEWAGSVKSAGSASSAAVGEAAVVANTNAAAAYLLGAERLFENAPKIEFEEVAVGDGEIVDAGASTTGHQVGSVVTVTVIVKDGDEAVKCTAEKVKALFRATSDLGDWNGAAKLEPEVSVEATDDPTTMRFKVKPGDGTSPRAFLQIRK